MPEPVNLRLHRKRKARAEQDAKAAANRAQHGRPKAQREADRQNEARVAKHLEGHRLERDGDAS